MVSRPPSGVLIVALLAGSLAGCYARRLAPPSRPAVQPSLVDHTPVHLYLREFEVEGQSKADTPIRIEALQDRFLDYLESRASFADVAYNLNGDARMESPALELKVKLAVAAETSRTWLLDAMNLPFLGGWPLVPAWGEAETTLTVIVAPPGGPPIATYRETVRAPFSALFYAWYRRRYVEQAFTRAAGEAFARVATTLAADLERRRNGWQGETAAPVDVASEQAVTETPNVTFLEAEGYHIVTSPPPARIDGSLLGYLKILGGLEVTGLWGLASVSSKARLESGADATVAGGTSTMRGYRIGLYSPPATTGAFIYPTGGYLNQQIDNIDAHSALADLNPLDAADGDIGAIATDPETGGGVDAGAANIYHLAMQSGYAGFRTGFDLVSGGGRVETFLSVTFGLNLVEYRKIASILDECGSDQPRSKCETKHQGWDFLKSGAVGGTVGIRVPALHTSLRLNVDYELYRAFQYEHPLEVRGPAIYRPPPEDIYEHEWVDMRGASLSTWVVQLALGVVF